MSALSCHHRTGERVTRRRSSDSAGTYETNAPGRQTAGRQGELPLTPPCYASAHRTRCGEGVGPISPAGDSDNKQRDTSKRSTKKDIRAGKVFARSYPFWRYTGMSSIAFRGNRRSSLRTCCFQETNLFL